MIKLPPCVKKAISVRDKEVLDEVFSFLRSYADDEAREAVLWGIGYYDLSNYQQRKLTAEAQINSAPFFICSIIEKPEHLSKYCTPEDEKTCPLRDDLTKLDMLIESVYLYHEEGRSYATLEVDLKDGTTFRRVNGTYGLLNPAPFWEVSAERFIEWYMATHRGKYPDVVRVETEDVVKLLKRRVVRMEVGQNASPMHQANAPEL